MTSVLPVDVEAGDPPVRNWRGVLVVFALVLDVRKFFWAAVLAPSLSGAVLIKNERSVGASGAYAVFLDGAMADPFLPALGVIADTPAAPKDAVVTFHQLGEGVPSRRVELPNVVFHRFNLPWLRSRESGPVLRAG